MARFVDTNVLVYAEDRDAGPKRSKALDLVMDLWDERDGVVSIQVLQEFYVTVTRKVRKPLSSAGATRIVEEYLSWTVVDGTAALLLGGLAIARRARLSLWDGLIVEAARMGGCEILYSEDLGHGQVIAGVRIVNPFL